MSDRSHNCEIQVTANGYLVMPPRGMSNIPTAFTDYYVFETFGAMTAWLDKTIRKPPAETGPGKIEQALAMKKRCYCMACDEFHEEGEVCRSCKKASPPTNP